MWQIISFQLFKQQTWRILSHIWMNIIIELFPCKVDPCISFSSMMLGLVEVVHSLFVARTKSLVIPVMSHETLPTKSKHAKSSPRITAIADIAHRSYRISFCQFFLELVVSWFLISWSERRWVWVFCSLASPRIASALCEVARFLQYFSSNQVPFAIETEVIGGDAGNHNFYVCH